MEFDLGCSLFVPPNVLCVLSTGSHIFSTVNDKWISVYSELLFCTLLSLVKLILVTVTGDIGVGLLLSTCMAGNSSNKVYPYLLPSVSGGLGSASSKLINLDRVLASVF